MCILNRLYNQGYNSHRDKRNIILPYYDRALINKHIITAGRLFYKQTSLKDSGKIKTCFAKETSLNDS